MRKVSPEHRAAKKAQWAAENRDSQLAYLKKWREDHREELKKMWSSPEYKAASKERWDIYKKNNPDRVREMARANARANYKPRVAKPRKCQSKEEQSARRRAYYFANREMMMERHRVWVRNNPDKAHAIDARYRARKSGNGGRHSAEEWNQKKDLFGHCCAYCGEEKTLTRDHKVPLFRGGRDDIHNIVPACQSCNSKKKTKTAYEYLGVA